MLPITINALELHKPELVPGSRAIGYWCEFVSELGSGSALFVPAGRAPAELPGKTVVVTLSQAAVSAMTPLPEGALRGRLEPLATPGDFQAEGQIRAITWMDDEQENALVEVVCGPCHFTFTAAESGLDDPEFGQWVRLELQGLTLWEALAGQG